MELTRNTRRPGRRFSNSHSWSWALLSVVLLLIPGCHKPAFDAPPLDRPERLPFAGWVKALAYTQKGRGLTAAGCENGALRKDKVCSEGLLQVWDMEQIRLQASYRFPSAVTALAVSPDGMKWVAGDTEGRVIVSTAATIVPVKPQHQSKEITALAFSPDGKWVASGSLDPAYPLGFLDMVTGGMIRVKVKFEPVSAVAFSLDGTHLAIGMTTGGLVIWDFAGSGGPIELSPSSRESHAVTSIAFSPNGRLLAYGRRAGETVVMAWRANQLLVEFRGGSTVNALAFSPDSRYLAIGRDNGKVLLVEPEQAVEIWTKRHLLSVSDLAYSPDGRALAVGTQHQVFLYRIRSEATVPPARAPEERKANSVPERRPEDGRNRKEGMAAEGLPSPTVGLWRGEKEP